MWCRLIGVNRAFVRAGLARSWRSWSVPVSRRWLRVADAEPPFTPYHLGFVFGPRINAGGRVGRCGLGVDLLTASGDRGSATTLPLQLDTHNRERQAIEKMILEEAIAMAETQANAPFLFVAGEGWHPGVVGIVAGTSEGTLRQAGLRRRLRRRTGPGLGTLYSGDRHRRRGQGGARAEVIESGGGHAMAAGFSLQARTGRTISRFSRRSLFEIGPTHSNRPANWSSTPSSRLLAPRSRWWRRLPRRGRSEPAIAEPLLAAARCGRGVSPMWWARTMSGCGWWAATAPRWTAIAFRVADTPLGKGLLAARGSRIHAVGRLRVDEWNGRKRVQLQLEDAASAGG